jgi:hypothetical protein
LQYSFHLIMRSSSPKIFLNDRPIGILLSDYAFYQLRGGPESEDRDP